MAYDNIVTPGQNFGAAKAGMDLSGVQYHVVQLVGSTVKLYTVATSGPGYVLYNTPSSGQAVEAFGSPNVVKAKVAGTVTAGQWLSVTGSAQFQADSSGGAVVGQAIVGGVADDIIAVKLI